MFSITSKHSVYNLFPRWKLKKKERKKVLKKRNNNDAKENRTVKTFSCLYIEASVYFHYLKIIKKL